MQAMARCHKIRCASVTLPLPECHLDQVFGHDVSDFEAVHRERRCHFSWAGGAAPTRSFVVEHEGLLKDTLIRHWVLSAVHNHKHCALLNVEGSQKMIIFGQEASPRIRADYLSVVLRPELHDLQVGGASQCHLKAFHHSTPGHRPSLNHPSLRPPSRASHEPTALTWQTPFPICLQQK